jgi:hypothetical protein
MCALHHHPAHRASSLGESPTRMAHQLFFNRHNKLCVRYPTEYIVLIPHDSTTGVVLTFLPQIKDDFAVT